MGNLFTRITFWQPFNQKKNPSANVDFVNNVNKEQGEKNLSFKTSDSTLKPFAKHNSSVPHGTPLFIRGDYTQVIQIE